MDACHGPLWHAGAFASGDIGPMEEHSFLQFAVIFLVAAAIAVPLFMRMGLSAVLGYLVAGVLIGPAGLGLIPASENTLSISELGVVLLLFLIGLELSPARVWLMRRAVFGVGSAQVIITAALIGVIALVCGIDWHIAIVAALGLALSSTAIDLQILSERKQLNHDHGRLAFAILLFQDLVTLPVIALVPLLALHTLPTPDTPIWQAGLCIVIVLIGVIGIGRFLVRPLFQMVSRTHSTEAFAATALLVVFGVAWLMELVGLSPALGAFLAGMLLAESEYRHEVESHIQPFKGLLLGLFFISVGMAVDLDLVLRETALVVGLTCALILLKMIVLYPIVRSSGRLDHRDGLRLSVLLCQGGEFGFIIFAVAAEHGIIDGDIRSMLVVMVTLSMALTPLLVAGLERWLARRTPVPEKPVYDAIEDGHPRVIVAGFGRMGQIVARILRAQKIAYVALENSPEQVDVSRRFGSTLYYGDPSRPELLRAAGAGQAEVFVAATDDPEQILRMVRMVKRQYPHLKILARARNRQHAFRLMDLGVDTIIRETFHSGLELSRATLLSLGLSAEDADDKVARFRAHDERLLRDQHPVYDDEAALMQANKDALKDLEKLFEADQ
jgi:glutathione-regulated potassium-efflux system protein KefB